MSTATAHWVIGPLSSALGRSFLGYLSVVAFEARSPYPRWSSIFAPNYAVGHMWDHCRLGKSKPPGWRSAVGRLACHDDHQLLRSEHSRGPPPLGGGCRRWWTGV